jgi:hypothetical protein
MLTLVDALIEDILRTRVNDHNRRWKYGVEDRRRSRMETVVVIVIRAMRVGLRTLGAGLLRLRRIRSIEHAESRRPRVIREARALREVLSRLISERHRSTRCREWCASSTGPRAQSAVQRRGLGATRDGGSGRGIVDGRERGGARGASRIEGVAAKGRSEGTHESARSSGQTRKENSSHTTGTACDRECTRH